MVDIAGGIIGLSDERAKDDIDDVDPSESEEVIRQLKRNPLPTNRRLILPKNHKSAKLPRMSKPLNRARLRNAPMG
ncbi:MAG: hypothetical protein U0Y68_18480 [Blastocatellia bacterium]